MDPERMMAQMMQNMGMGFGGFPFGSLLDPFNQNAGQFPSNPMMTQGFMSPAMNPVSLMPMMNSSLMNPGLMMQSMSTIPSGGMSYCSSSVTSYTTDQNGRPHVFQQSQEVKQGPNGIKETKSAMRDSRSGQQELTIGHHMNEKAHIKKKARNVYSGEDEQTEDFVNLDDDEVESFEQNWTQQARSINPQRDCIRSGNSSQPHRLAISNTAYPSSVQQPNQRQKNPLKMKKEKKRRDKDPSRS